jgi:hypothetical protein
VVYRQCSKTINYLLEVQLCLEEMEPDLPGGAVQVLEEVQAEAAGVPAE